MGIRGIQLPCFNLRGFVDFTSTKLAFAPSTICHSLSPEFPYEIFVPSMDSKGEADLPLPKGQFEHEHVVRGRMAGLWQLCALGTTVLLGARRLNWQASNRTMGKVGVVTQGDAGLKCVVVQRKALTNLHRSTNTLLSQHPSRRRLVTVPCLLLLF